MKSINKYFFLAGSVVLFMSCGGGKEEEKTTDTLSVKEDSSKKKSEQEELKEFKFFSVIGAIPSPAHEIVEINKAGIKYNATLPNPAENESKYADLYKACLNYGVYSCDLAYCASFKENADLMKYFLVNRKMAEKAGALSIFEEITKQYGFESNTKNADSLEAILDKVYFATEKFCQDQHKLDVAVKILLGSWIESQYLTLSSLTSVAKPEKANMLRTKVWENYLHLRNILDLLKEYENHPELNALNDELTKYATLYQDAHGPEDFSKEKISGMHTAISSIRSNVVK